MTEPRPYDERPAARPSFPENGSSEGEFSGLQSADIPSPSDSIPPSKKRPGCFSIGCGSVVAIFVILFVIAFVQMMSNGGGSGSRSDQDLAVVTCQNLVRNNLKAPSTAKFPSVPKYSGGTISGKVDAENSFGAMIRSDFQCTVQGDTVRLDFVK